MKKENGITLIALVITIIVMLILVGVTVTVALNGGLFNTAKDAVEQTQIEADKEQLLSAAIGAIKSDGTVDFEKLDTDLQSSEFEGANGTYSKNGYTYKVDEYGNVEILLPKEYTEVEYLESTGTQYIKTGVMGKKETIIEANCSPRNQVLYQCVFGTNYGINIFYEQGKYRGPGTISIEKSENEYDSISAFLSENNTRGIVINDTTSNGSNASKYNEIFLFGLEDSGKIYAGSGRASNDPAQFIGRLRDIVIIQNKKILRDFIPAKRISDNKPGLYDTVTGEFYVNQGSGDDFIAGPEV